MKLYWYGRTDVAMSSDTDGDGKTFAEMTPDEKNGVSHRARAGEEMRRIMAGLAENP